MSWKEILHLNKWSENVYRIGATVIMLLMLASCMSETQSRIYAAENYMDNNPEWTSQVPLLCLNALTRIGTYGNDGKFKGSGEAVGKGQVIIDGEEYPLFGLLTAKHVIEEDFPIGSKMTINQPNRVRSSGYKVVSRVDLPTEGNENTDLSYLVIMGLDSDDHE